MGLILGEMFLSGFDLVCNIIRYAAIVFVFKRPNVDLEFADIGVDRVPI